MESIFGQTIALEVEPWDAHEVRRPYVAYFWTEEQALGFIDTRQKTYFFREVEAQPIPTRYTRLLATVYPQCEHNMDARLCRGPAHYATYEEIAMGY